MIDHFYLRSFLSEKRMILFINGSGCLVHVLLIIILDFRAMSLQRSFANYFSGAFGNESCGEGERQVPQESGLGLEVGVLSCFFYVVFWLIRLIGGQHHSSFLLFCLGTCFFVGQLELTHWSKFGWMPAKKIWASLPEDVKPQFWPWASSGLATCLQASRFQDAKQMELMVTWHGSLQCYEHKTTTSQIYMLHVKSISSRYHSTRNTIEILL